MTRELPTIAPRAKRLEGSRVLVVGGGAGADPGGDAPPGNGSAIGMLAAAHGASVAVADIDAAAAGRTVAEIAGIEGAPGAHMIVADVRDPDACARMVDEAAAALGGLDGVVANVGVGAGAFLAGTSVESWDRVLEVNVRAHFLIAKRALPMMENGSIVFVGSLAGLRPGSFSPSYDTSKAALLGLSRHVAMEGAGRAVRANVVAPGLIDTPMGRAASAANPLRERIRIPLGHQGSAWDVAHAVLYLLSPESSYVTGQVLVVDGGLGSIGG